MNQKDKVNVMNKTTYRYHINSLSAAEEPLGGKEALTEVA